MIGHHKIPSDHDRHSRHLQRKHVNGHPLLSRREPGLEPTKTRERSLGHLHNSKNTNRDSNGKAQVIVTTADV